MDYEKPHITSNRNLLKKYKSFAYKQCEDFNNTEMLIAKFPQSHFFWVVRDGRDVVNSIAFPSRKSFPVRVFPGVKEIASQRKWTEFQASIFIWLDYMQCQEKMETVDSSRVTKLSYSSLVAFPRKTILETYGKHFTLSESQIKTMVNTVKKTPHQNSWLTWTDDQKETFKRFPGANDMLIRHGFVSDDSW